MVFTSDLHDMYPSINASLGHARSNVLALKANAEEFAGTQAWKSLFKREGREPTGQVALVALQQ